MIERKIPHVLVVFGTWHGQTERIAEEVGALARRRGYDVVVSSAEAAEERYDLTTFDRFIICAGVHLQRHHRLVRELVARNLPEISSRPSALVSVSMAAASPRGSANRKGIEHVVDAFRRSTGWSPDVVVYAAGALHYTRYGFFTRWFMRRISAANGGPTDITRNHEMTDWEQLERDIAPFLPDVRAKHDTQHAAVR